MPTQLTSRSSEPKMRPHRVGCAADVVDVANVERHRHGVASFVGQGVRKVLCLRGIPSTNGHPGPAGDQAANNGCAQIPIAAGHKGNLTIKRLVHGDVSPCEDHR
jgi:hypothetical protein